MSAPRPPDDHRPQAAGGDAFEDGPLLSMYLAGELGAGEVEALEARLAEDTRLRGRLDAMADALWSLGTASAPPPPTGFDDRLATRLAEARDEAPPVASLAAARERRSRRGATWVAWSGAAAAVLAIVVFGGTLLTGGVDPREQAASDEAAHEFAAEEPAADAEPEAFVDEMRQQSDGAAEPVPAAPADGATTGQRVSPPAAPWIADEGTTITGEEDMRDRYAITRQVVGLLGMPLSEAEDVAASFRVAVQRHPAFAPGMRPDACLDLLAAGTPGPVVPGIVEWATFEDEPAIVYVLITASGGAPALDRAEAWVVEPERCAARFFVTLTAEG